MRVRMQPVDLLLLLFPQQIAMPLFTSPAYRDIAPSGLSCSPSEPMVPEQGVPTGSLICVEVPEKINVRYATAGIALG